MKEFCKAHNLTEDQFLGKEVIECSLSLDSVTTIPEGFNPTVEWNLYLRSVETIPEGFSLLVVDIL